MEITKCCTICGVSYGPGTRKPKQFEKSKYCSLACAHKDQQNTLDDILVRCVRDPEKGCLLWTGPVNRKGYGRTRVAGKKKLVHVAVWEFRHGKVPRGLQLDHECAVKRCCEDLHVIAKTCQANILAPTCNNMAARYARRTECDKCGGPFSTFPNGIRYCKPCRNQKMMIAQQKRRAIKKNNSPAPDSPAGTNNEEKSP